MQSVHPSSCATDLDFRDIFFAISFQPFWEIQKRILKNCPYEQRSCMRTRSKKKTAVHENSFAYPLSDFPIKR